MSGTGYGERGQRGRIGGECADETSLSCSTPPLTLSRWRPYTCAHEAVLSRRPQNPKAARTRRTPKYSHARCSSMKAEKRHELQQNELADWLGEQIEAAKPYSGT